MVRIDPGPDAVSGGLTGHASPEVGEETPRVRSPGPQLPRPHVGCGKASAIDTDMPRRAVRVYPAHILAPGQDN